MAFYAKDYQFVGFLSGLYYDQAGNPTEYLEQVFISDFIPLQMKVSGEAKN